MHNISLLCIIIIIFINLSSVWSTLSRADPPTLSFSMPSSSTLAEGAAAALAVQLSGGNPAWPNAADYRVRWCFTPATYAQPFVDARALRVRSPLSSVSASSGSSSSGSASSSSSSSSSSGSESSAGSGKRVRRRRQASSGAVPLCGEALATAFGSSLLVDDSVPQLSFQPIQYFHAGVYKFELTSSLAASVSKEHSFDVLCMLHTLLFSNVH